MQNTDILPAIPPVKVSTTSMCLSVLPPYWARVIPPLVAGLEPTKRKRLKSHSLNIKYNYILKSCKLLPVVNSNALIKVFEAFKAFALIVTSIANNVVRT